MKILDRRRAVIPVRTLRWRRPRSMIAGLVAVSLAAVAGCTSSGGPQPSPPGSSGAGSSIARTPTPTSSVASGTTDAPASSGFAALRGAFLVVGPGASSSDVYEVTATGLARRTTGARVSAVTADTDRVIVAAGSGSRLSALIGNRLHPTGTASAFSPALSPQGALATVALQAGPATPGVTKPKGFALLVQARDGAAPRPRYVTVSSLGNPVWTSRNTVVVAASNGPATQLLRVDTAGGSSRVIATLPDGSGLDLTGGARYLTASSSKGQVVLPIGGGSQRPLPAGWTPLCWTHPATLIAARGADVASISVTPSAVGAPKRVGRAPAGQRVLGAACSRVSG